MDRVRKNRRLAAIVAADVAGFSRLMGTDEEGTLNALQKCQTGLIMPIVSEYGGRVVKTMGDGLLIEFPSAVDAVHCSIEIQKSMRSQNVEIPPGRRIEFRIGINVGDIIVEEEDIFGDGVNIAARLEGISDPGGICISETVLNQVRGRIDVLAEDMGQRSLKNIEKPVRAFRIAEANSTGDSIPDDGAFSFPSEKPSLAILPFRNLGPSADADYIADGISLGIQTLLVQLPNMFFVNACQHEGYRQKKMSASEALSHMPVRYAVEGWVQQAAHRVRVSTQVTDLTNGAAIWAETYDRELADIFGLQDEIARRIAAALSTELIGGHLARDFTGGLDSPGAWEHFLRGINHFYRGTKREFMLAIARFEALAEAHPNSAIGPCYLCVIYFSGAKQDWNLSGKDDLKKAEEWANRAIQLEDGNNGLGHAVLGAIALDQKRHSESLELCRRAVSYRASCPFANSQLGIALTYSGDPAMGIKHLRDAISVHSTEASPPELNALAVAYRDHGDIKLSIPAASEAARLNPDYLDAYVTLGSDYALAGDGAEAKNVTEQINSIEPNFSIETYLSRLPYRDKSALERVAAALETAGLPH